MIRLERLTVRNTWLQVTVLANQRTGLAASDVFYFASVAGETGAGGDAFGFADTTDQAAIRQNPTLGLSIAQLDNPYDIDRSKRVDSNDRLIIRQSPVTGFSRVLPITVPAAGDGGGSVTAETSSKSLSQVGEAVFAESESIESAPIRHRPLDGRSPRRTTAPVRWLNEPSNPSSANGDAESLAWASNRPQRRRARMDREVLESLFEQLALVE